MRIFHFQLPERKGRTNWGSREDFRDHAWKWLPSVSSTFCWLELNIFSVKKKLQMRFSCVCIKGKCNWKGARDLIDPFWSPTVNCIICLKHEICWPSPYRGQLNVLSKETISPDDMQDSLSQMSALMIWWSTRIRHLPLIFLSSSPQVII